MGSLQPFCCWVWLTEWRTDALTDSFSGISCAPYRDDNSGAADMTARLHAQANTVAHKHTYGGMHVCTNVHTYIYAHSCIALCVCMHTLAHILNLLACVPARGKGRATTTMRCYSTRRNERRANCRSGRERERGQKIGGERGEVRRRGAAQAPQWAPLT